MDGVLVDLNAGYKQVTGMTMPEADKFYNYDHELFWEQPKKVPYFWTYLPKMSRAEILIEFLFKLRYWGMNVFFLTSSVRDYKFCAADKRDWIDKHTPFPKENCLVVRRSEKQMFATSKGEPNILIDDYEKNIEEWEKAGGVGILYKDEPVHNTIDKLELLTRTIY